MRRRSVVVVGLFVVSAVVLLFAPTATAQTGSLTFDPPTVTAGGGKLFINGSCEPNTSGFVISEAFAGQPSVGDFAGVPALSISTGSDGTFGIGLTIAPTIAPGAYPVGLRCGGGLAASGTLTVKAGSLAATGARIDVVVAVGAVLIAAGLTLMASLRRGRRAVDH